MFGAVSTRNAETMMMMMMWRLRHIQTFDVNACTCGKVPPNGVRKIHNHQ